MRDITINAIFNFLKEAVLELHDIDEDDITVGTELADIGLDSLDYVDIQVNIRREFGVQVKGDVFTSGLVKTFGQLADYIAEHAAAQRQQTVAA